MSAEAIYDEATHDVTVTGHRDTAEADEAARRCAREHGRVVGENTAERGRLTYITQPA